MLCGWLLSATPAARLVLRANPSRYRIRMAAAFAPSPWREAARHRTPRRARTCAPPTVSGRASSPARGRSKDPSPGPLPWCCGTAETWISTSFGNPNPQSIPPMRIWSSRRSRDRELTLFRWIRFHGIARVHDQVEQDLLELHAIRHRRRQIAGREIRDGDSARNEIAAGEAQQLFETSPSRSLVWTVTSPRRSIVRRRSMISLARSPPR